MQTLLFPSLSTVTHHHSNMYIPYSGKFWQEKILANLASMHGFAKILFAIFINTESAVDAVHR